MPNSGVQPAMIMTMTRIYEIDTGARRQSNPICVFSIIMNKQPELHH